MRVLHHHRIVDYTHIGHTAGCMAGVDIFAEQAELLGTGYGFHWPSDQIRIALFDTAHRRRWLEFVNKHPHRNAGAATLAGRPVGDVLAAPKTAFAQDIVQLGRQFTNQMGKHLAFRLALDIRAGRRRRQIELRGVMRLISHGQHIEYLRRPDNLAAIKVDNTMGRSSCSQATGSAPAGCPFSGNP